MAFRYERCVAFICPHCSEISEKKLSIFNFSGCNCLNLLCTDTDCKKVAATIKVASNKYKISVNCPVCGDKHSFTVSKNAFWNKALMTFSCPEAFDADILFIGNKTNVSNAISDIADDFDEADYENILFGIVDHLNSLLSSGHIHCHCGSNDIFPTASGNKIVLACSECKAQITIEINEQNLERLLAASDLFI